jgi:1,2-diacylglycerol 3-alpha-glucosyltransferase
MKPSSKPIHIVLMWANFGPYILARLKATRILGEHKHCRVQGLELSGKLHRYPWQVENDELDKITLFPDKAGEEVSFFSYVRHTWQTLQETQPDVLALAGYDTPAVLTALAWAKINGKLVICMSDSKADDRVRQGWKEGLKRLLVSRFDAALVGGIPQMEYAISLGIPPERVFVGYDVVDNEHFARRATAARAQEARLRRELGLPNQYFLAVCRFIEEKNLVRLFAAYRLYRQRYPNPWELVLCGSGPLETTLRETAADLPGVYFPGFKQDNALHDYYALAQVLILSSISETWGLVVNEAMAAGLPVLVSRACGCAPDLVLEGVNGYTFDPYDVEGLTRLMVRMSSGVVDLKAMGQASLRIIADWTPEVFAQNLFKAVDISLTKKVLKDAN